MFCQARGISPLVDAISNSIIKNRRQKPSERTIVATNLFNALSASGINQKMNIREKE